MSTHQRTVSTEHQPRVPVADAAVADTSPFAHGVPVVDRVKRAAARMALGLQRVGFVVCGTIAGSAGLSAAAIAGTAPDAQTMAAWAAAGLATGMLKRMYDSVQEMQPFQKAIPAPTTKSLMRQVSTTLRRAARPLDATTFGSTACGAVALMGCGSLVASVLGESCTSVVDGTVSPTAMLSEAAGGILIIGGLAAKTAIHVHESIAIDRWQSQAFTGGKRGSPAVQDPS